MASGQQKYEYLDSLIGGWFHQDFDINGSTLEEIMASYRKKAKTQEQEGLVRDIHAYLSAHPEDGELEESFVQTFRPEFVQDAWGLTTRGFLSRIASLLGG